MSKNLVPLIAPSGVLIYTSEERSAYLKERNGYRSPVTETTESVDLTPKPRRRTTKKSEDDG